jgi:hypothetical protein
MEEQPDPHDDRGPWPKAPWNLRRNRARPFVSLRVVPVACDRFERSDVIERAEAASVLHLLGDAPR